MFDPRAEEYIENLTSAKHREIIHALRMLIFACIPDVQEKFKYKIPFYNYDGELFYLTVQKGKVVLGLVYGVKMNPRPGILLAEYNKQIRHLVFEKESDIYEDYVVEIILEALEYNIRKASEKKKK
jgi:hypothetical protein